LNPSNKPNKKSIICWQVPSEHSSQNRNLCQGIINIIKWRAERNNDNGGIEEVLKGLEYAFEDDFFQQVKMKGYCTKMMPKITATFWLAMSEETMLCVGQQGII